MGTCTVRTSRRTSAAPTRSTVVPLPVPTPRAVPWLIVVRNARPPESVTVFSLVPSATLSVNPPELLLTRDEAAAILRSNSCAAGTNAAATGPAEAISSGGGGGGYGSDREGDSRREAEALALLLSSSDGGGGAGSGRGAPTGMAAESALTRLAARYLVRETVRGKIPDPISNGARVERVNWMADLSPRGIENSFGVMVNYVYDPLEIESNNRLYLSRGEVPASDGARELAWSLRDAEARSAGEGDPKDGGRDGGGRHGAGGEGQTPPRAAL